MYLTEFRRILGIRDPRERICRLEMFRMKLWSEYKDDDVREILCGHIRGFESIGVYLSQAWEEVRKRDAQATALREEAKRRRAVSNGQVWWGPE